MADVVEVTGCERNRQVEWPQLANVVVEDVLKHVIRESEDKHPTVASLSQYLLSVVYDRGKPSSRSWRADELTTIVDDYTALFLITRRTLVYKVQGFATV